MVVRATVTRSSLWSAFRGSRLWHGLRRVRFLRECVHFATDFRELLRDYWGDDPSIFEREFVTRLDPWNFDSSPSERKRFEHMRSLVLPEEAAAQWQSALEIGCAEGAFSELLAPYCRQLLCVDVSPTALQRAGSRRAWGRSVRFGNWNFRRQTLHDSFDLIVVACVLEYIASPWELRLARDRILALLKPGGRLLVVTTRRSDIVENAWWGRALKRGRWINAFFEEHPQLAVMASETGTKFAYSLLHKPLHG